MDKISFFSVYGIIKQKAENLNLWRVFKCWIIPYLPQSRHSYCINLPSACYILGRSFFCFSLSRGSCMRMAKKTKKKHTEHERMHVFDTTEHERNALHTRITHWIWGQIPFWHTCMSILYTLWTEHVKIQAIHALKRQINTKRCQKYHEKCEKIPVLRCQKFHFWHPSRAQCVFFSGHFLEIFV